MASGRQLQKSSLQKKTRVFIHGSRSSICLRCGGLLVQSDFLNLMKGAMKQEDTVIRCVQCGDLVDRIIFKNRASQISAIS